MNKKGLNFYNVDLKLQKMEKDLAEIKEWLKEREGSDEKIRVSNEK